MSYKLRAIVSFTIAAAAFGVAIVQGVKVQQPISAGAATGTVRVAAAGDICGDCRGTSDLIIARNPGAVVTLGDNAYDAGTLSQYQNQYDPTWGRFKAKTKPSPGNHEWMTSNAQGYRDYFGFTDTQPLYGSFNKKAWHFVRLDTEQLSSTQQENWMKTNLANDTHQCEVVYGHHPRWSSGEHGSQSELTNAWNIAANAGVDIWLAGHDHDYERFALINGIREFVVGTGGAGAYAFRSPIAGSEVRITNVKGVLFLSLKPGAYEWRFRNTAGTLLDSGSGVCR